MTAAAAAVAVAAVGGHGADAGARHRVCGWHWLLLRWGLPYVFGGWL